MAGDALLAAALILVLGISSQYLAWRLRIPSILVLLVAGFLAGPVMGIVRPDDLLGVDLLRPVVALSVAVILFEGGLGLDFREIRQHSRIVARLVTVGVLITWIVGAVAAHTILGLDWGVAALLGAILVVSGPTVVLPLLRHLRPKREVEAVARWEGILIDPIGAVLAVLVFEAVLLEASADTFWTLLGSLLSTFAVGALVGAAAAALIVLLESRYWVPDHLAVAVSLALVVTAYTASDLLRPESGLLAATLMGVILANQRRASTRHILAFKEDLSLILIGTLFILLAARLELDAVAAVALDWRPWLFIAALVLVARPLAVLASSAGTSLDWNGRALLMWLAPRGIVAAAVAAFFSLRLEPHIFPDADRFVALTFLVIVATVALYGLTARPVGRLLKVAGPEPQGVLIVGANPVGRAFARLLQEEGYRALIVDMDTQALNAARTDGLEAVKANVHSVQLTEAIDLGGIGKLWAVTPNEDTNALAAVHFADEFGRARVYQVATRAGSKEQERAEGMHAHLRGRALFSRELTYRVLRDRITSDEWTIRRTPITERFTEADYWHHYGEDAVPLWLIAWDRRLRVFTEGYAPEIRAGRTLVSLVRRPPPTEAPDEAT